MSNRKAKVILASVVLVTALPALSLLYHGGVASASDGPRCNDRLLRGTYGGSFQFLNLPPGSPVPQPIGDNTHYPGAGIGVTTFDGQGGFFGSQTVSIGGYVFPSTVWGTYTVNSDCTGTQTINFGSGGTAELDFVIVDDGKEVHTLSTTPGDVAFGILKKQFATPF